jgi:hypothetical protein
MIVVRTEVPNNREEPAQIIAAAEKGEAWAQNWMGGECWKARDLATAIEWFRKAARQGDGNAQLTLAGCYEDGYGVQKDPTEARKWYEKGIESFRQAAMQGDRNAQLSLARCYEDGQGVEKNPTEAQKWHEKAAGQGQDDAQLALGFLFDQKDDFKSAYYWYRRSAEQGNAIAQNNLAILYSQGKGIPTNFVEAYKWCNLAAAQGNETSLRHREFIAKKMTREQIAEGQRRAEGFIAKQETSSKPQESAPTEDAVPRDVTHLIERLGAFEDHLNVRLEALNASFFLGATDKVLWLRVCGELHASDGVALKYNVKVVVDAYDSGGKILSTGWQCLSDSEKFYGFETFMIHINVSGPVAKVRVYPKRV